MQKHLSNNYIMLKGIDFWFIFTIILGFGSCTFDVNKKEAKQLTKNSRQKPEKSPDLDTLSIMDADDFPVSNAMLEKELDNCSKSKFKCGACYSHDKAWFSNDSLKQTLVFEIYTDFHRLVSYHFYNNDIPEQLLSQLEQNDKNGKLAPISQKQKDIIGFVQNATKINLNYFVSKKGFKLGNSREKAINYYGKPDKSSARNGIEELEWRFNGDNCKSDAKSKFVVANSFGHIVKMYFRKGKLLAQILKNEIP